MIYLIYNTVLFLYYALLHISALFNKKASKWVAGQRLDLSYLKIWRNKHTAKKLVWFHCASLGEFEEAKAFRNILNTQYNSLIFCYSFFSPSGFEHAEIPENDLKFYLPMDFIKRQKTVLELLNPELFIFIKYEYWFNLLKLLKVLKIKYGFINSTLDGSEYFQKIKPFSNLVISASFIQTTNKSNRDNLISKGFKNIYLAKDLRWLSAETNFKFDYHPKFNFKEITKPIFILGSVHKEDYDFLSVILSYLNDFFIIIAPHEIDQVSIRALKKLVPENFKLYSSATIQGKTNGIILDTIGDLKYIYRYASIAYIGGGLGDGLHNVFESLIYDIPTLYSGKNLNLKECNNLINIKNTHELKLTIEAQLSNRLIVNKLTENISIDHNISFVNTSVNTIFEQILR